MTGDATTVRLADDYLLRAWPRLARLIERDRDALSLRARLERQSNDWKGHAGELLSRDAVKVAQQWLDQARVAGRASPEIEHFVAASVARQRRRRSTVVGAVAIIGALAVIAVVAGVLATIGARSLDERADTERARRLGITAETLAATDPQLAVLLANRAALIEDVPEAWRAVIRAVENDPGDSAIMTDYDSPVARVAFSPDGKMLATTTLDGDVRIRDAATRGVIRTYTGHTDRVLGVAFSPNGAMLATASHDDSVRLWDVESGSVRVLVGHTDDVLGVAFSPDGSSLATTSFDGTTLPGMSTPERQRGQSPPKRSTMDLSTWPSPPMARSSLWRRPTAPCSCGRERTTNRAS